jgi:hypothetical protein
VDDSYPFWGEAAPIGACARRAQGGRQKRSQQAHAPRASRPICNRLRLRFFGWGRNLKSGLLMKLCGQISVELTVGDYIEAADHQKRLEDILKLVRDAYPEATLAMRERRQRKAGPLVRAPRAPATGALQRYEES